MKKGKGKEKTTLNRPNLNELILNVYVCVDACGYINVLMCVDMPVETGN